MFTDSSRQHVRCNNGETTVFYGVSHFSVPAKQSTRPIRSQLMAYSPQVFEVGGEKILVCKANRLTDFVFDSDVAGIQDLKNILNYLLRTKINAVLAYLPKRIESGYGWAVYRNGIVEFSREESVNIPSFYRS